MLKSQLVDSVQIWAGFQGKLLLSLLRWAGPGLDHKPMSGVYKKFSKRYGPGLDNKPMFGL